MRRLWLAVLATVLSACLPAPAQNQAPPPFPLAQDTAALVRDWYHHFLDRDIDAEGLAYFTAQQREGQTQEGLLTALLESDEYYQRAGGTPEGFARTLLFDFTGRPPSAAE